MLFLGIVVLGGREPSLAVVMAPPEPRAMGEASFWETRIGVLS